LGLWTLSNPFLDSRGIEDGFLMGLDQWEVVQKTLEVFTENLKVIGDVQVSVCEFLSNLDSEILHS